MKEWEPITKNPVLEPYVSTDETNSTVGQIFIAMGVMAIASILAILLYWSYNRGPYLFFTLISVFVFLYALKMLILIFVIRDKLKIWVFRFYVGSTVFMCMLSLILIAFFGYKTSQNTRPVITSTQNTFSVPPTLSVNGFSR